MKRFRPEQYILLALCGFLLSVAVTVDYHRVVNYLFSDESVYYMMAESFAYDQDLEYTQKDLMRVYKDGWHAGPQGVFLTKTENGKIFYSKSFVYAMVLAPFILVFGFKGFLILNIILLLLMIWMGWAYLRQFNSPLLSLAVSITFFLLSASFIYTFWITPETFNMFCITLGLFLWLYQREKRHLEPGQSLSGARAARSLPVRVLLAPWALIKWLITTPQGRLYLAPLPIAVACASKLPNGLFILPIVFDVIVEGSRLIFRESQASSAGSSRFPLHWRSRTLWVWFRRLVVVCAVFWAVVIVFYALQNVFTGHYNPYAGDRKTFYWSFPFSSAVDVWERGVRLSNDDYNETSFYFHPKSFLYNLYYYMFGRFTGMIPYFFCSLLALYYFVRSLLFRQPEADVTLSRKRSIQTGTSLRRTLLLLTIVISIIAYIYKAPSNYQGGGGAFGNRFFLNIYPAFLFLVTAIPGMKALVVSFIVGAVFLAQSLLNPFQSSWFPAAQGFRWPYRMFPVELTLIDTLPTNVNHHLMQMVHDGEPPFRLYFFDEYASDIQSSGFWVQGEKTAELAVRTYEPQKHLVVTVENGPVGNQVDVTVAGITQTITFSAPRKTEHLVFPLNWSMPYFSSSIYPVKIRSHTGYVPRYTLGSGLNDYRYLGCRVHISLNPLDVGKAYLEHHQVQEAIAVLEPLVKDKSENIDARYALAVAYHETGTPEAALEQLRQCKQLLPEFQEDMLDTCEDLGDACTSELMRSAEPDTEGSLSALLRPLIRRYEAEEDSFNTGEVLTLEGASNGEVLSFNPPEDAPGFLLYGQYAEYQPGQYQARFHINIRERNDSQPQSIVSALFLEVYHKQFGIIERKRIPLESGIDRQPDIFGDYTLNFDLKKPATLEFRVETTGQAHVDVDYIDVYPRLPLQIYQTLAEVSLQQGAYDEALAYAQQIIGIDPWTPESQVTLLQVFRKTEQWEEALNLINKSFRSSSTHTGLASAVFEAGGDEHPQIQQAFEELHAPFTPAIPVNAVFADSIEFLGYDISATTLKPGELFTIHYLWKSLKPVEAEYTIFVHFIKQGEFFASETLSKIKRRLGVPVKRMFQHDHQPLNGAYPTSDWLPHELIHEHYEVNVPANLEPGTYEIWIGLWNPLTKTRLTSEGQNKIHIGELHIQSPPQSEAKLFPQSFASQAPCLQHILRGMSCSQKGKPQNRVRRHYATCT